MSRVTCETRCVPRLTGCLAISLTVRDPVSSADWYCKVLGLEVAREYEWPGGRDVCLRHIPTGLEIALLNHQSNPGDAFSEDRTGLDHLEFLVAERADLDEWAAHLDSLGISHSGVKEPPHTQNAMLT